MPLNVLSIFFSSYHILHLQFVGPDVHMRSRTSDLGCWSGCKKRLKIDRPCVGSDLAERFEYNVPNLKPRWSFFTAFLKPFSETGRVKVVHSIMVWWPLCISPIIGDEGSIPGRVVLERFFTPLLYS